MCISRIWNFAWWKYNYEKFAVTPCEHHLLSSVGSEKNWGSTFRSVCSDRLLTFNHVYIYLLGRLCSFENLSCYMYVFYCRRVGFLFRIQETSLYACRYHDIINNPDITSWTITFRLDFFKIKFLVKNSKQYHRISRYFFMIYRGLKKAKSPKLTSLLHVRRSRFSEFRRLLNSEWTTSPTKPLLPNYLVTVQDLISTLPQPQEKRTLQGADSPNHLINSTLKIRTGT